eukprot:3940913-Rhodomonas_salina.1
MLLGALAKHRDGADGSLSSSLREIKRDPLPFPYSLYRIVFDFAVLFPSTGASAMSRGALRAGTWGQAAAEDLGSPYRAQLLPAP